MKQKEQLIKDCRKLVGDICELYRINHTQLAHMAGVSHTTITRIMSPEAKHTFSGLTLNKINAKFPLEAKIFMTKYSLVDEQLDSAIESWFYGRDKSSRTLIFALYKEMFPDRGSFEDQSTEALIMGIMIELGFSAKPFTKKQDAFHIWLAATNSLFAAKSEFREFCLNLIKVKTGLDSGEITKVVFYEAYIGRHGGGD